MRGVRLSLAIFLAAFVPVQGQDTRPSTRSSTLPSAVQDPAHSSIEENLTHLTGNNSLQTRRIGARGLLVTVTPEVLAKLSEILNRGDDGAAQIAICQELATLDEPPSGLIQPVLELLASSRAEIGAAAARAIARFDRSEVIPRLKQMAQGRVPSGNGRLAAIAALGRMGDSPAAVQALVEVLADPDVEIQAAALTAFERASLVRAADAAEARQWWQRNRGQDLATWLRRRAGRQEALRESLEEQIVTLARRLADQKRTEYLRRPEAEKQALLVEYLRDPQASIRRLGLDLTDALITDRKPVPPAVAEQVRQLLSDAVPDHRRLAASILGVVQDGRDAALLMKALPDEPVSRVRAAMVKALGLLGDVPVLAVLERALEDRSREVVSGAVEAIGLVCERAADAPKVRERVATHLASRLEALQPAEPALVESFLTAMTRIGDPRFAAAFATYMQPGRPPAVRQAAIRGAAVLNLPELADRMAGLLSDEVPGVRLAAARALGGCGRSDAHLDALRRRVESPAETDETVRAGAWNSFVRLWAARPVDQRLRWVERLSDAADQAAVTRRIDLLKSLDQAVNKDQANAGLRPRLYEMLGDAHVDLKRPADAVPYYQQALAAQGGFRLALATKAVRTALRVEQFDATVAILRDALKATSHSPATQARPLIDVVLAEARAYLEQRRVQPVEALLDTIESSLADALPPDWAEPLAGLRRELQATRGRIEAETVQALIAGLAADEATAGQASGALVKRGRAALPALLAALERQPATTAPATPIERRLIECIRRIEPQWPGIPSGADAAARRDALDDLQRRITATTAPASTPSGG